ncbi:LLM class flavin-dependent oxidoreductase [Couchioplanes azureus]|uniref:LLM class flavin-dependent oxidoreductase n=1 Tax=Couchioplanes caeruleus TaxID=56438 RepID=UPI001670C68A|nr:LLM class flavin-dependent oxidoreductase [Couchioplanes caeruleus]GGQ76313.1 monooxygenase [Couchioplanes caeruleus subsp. azureus]
MEFGINFFPVVDPSRKSATAYFDESLELVELADRLGYEHVQTVEHYGTPYGGYSPDPVTFLTAAAARTSRIRVCTGAIIAAFSHPVQVAGKLAMLDHLSHGRLDAGFGRGFLPDEFATFEVPMDSSRARFAAMVETVRRLWTEEDVVSESPFFRFGPITMLPRPFQNPHPPIFVASATSAESCAAAGTAGHHLQVVPSVTSAEALREMIGAYRRAWAAAGHSGTPRIQIKYTVYVAADRTEALAAGAEHERNYVSQMAEAVASWAGARSDQYPGYEKFVEKARTYDFDAALRGNKVLAGTPDDVSAQLSAIRDDYGADLSVSLQFNPGTTTLAAAREAMTLFAREVAPVFRGELAGAAR